MRRRLVATLQASRHVAVTKMIAVVAVVVAIANPVVHAQSYPSRQITLIVPFAAGGSNDIVARAITKALAEAWGKPVIAENRPGAVIEFSQGP